MSAPGGGGDHRGTDEILALVDRFERCELTREEWNHRAHLTVAMSYLAREGVAAGNDRMIEGIRRFNASKGIVPTPRGGYHETLTRFWLEVGRRVLDRGEGRSVLELVNLFQRMPKDLPLRCYSESVLWSPEARARWVRPDLLDIDDAIDEALAGSAMRAPIGSDAIA